MPAPFAHGSQGYTVFILSRESLHTGRIDRDGKVAVADSQRGQGVDGSKHRIVTRDKGDTVDWLRHIAAIVAKALYFERSPNKRTYAPGIVVAHFLLNIIIKRPVATSVFLDLGCCSLYLVAHTRAKPRYRATVCKRNSCIGINLINLSRMPR